MSTIPTPPLPLRAWRRQIQCSMLRTDGPKSERRRVRVLRRDGYRCVYCGRDFLASVDDLFAATVDHVVSRRAGGKSTMDNMVACCRACNTLKAHAVVNSIDQAKKVIAKQRDLAAEVFEEGAARFGFPFPRQQKGGAA